MSVINPRDAPASSPCVGRCSHCVGDEICRGCGRTVEEVVQWNSYSDAQKIEIKQRLAARLKTSKP